MQPIHHMYGGLCVTLNIACVSKKRVTDMCAYLHVYVHMYVFVLPRPSIPAAMALLEGMMEILGPTCDEVTTMPCTVCV